MVKVITLNTGDITYNVTSTKGYHYDSGEITSNGITSYNWFYL